MNQPFIEVIHGNIKGGVDATLGPKTLIVGRCRTGKSKHVAAVELLAAGGASDLGWRPWVKHEGMLREYLTDGTPIMVRGKTSTGAATHYMSSQGVKLDHLPAGLVHAYQLVREALTGEADKAYRFLLSAATRGKVTAGDVRLVLDNAHTPGDDRARMLCRSILPQLFAPADASGPAPLDELMAAPKEAGRRRRVAKTEADGAQKTIEAMSRGVSVPLASDIASARAKLAELEAQADAARGPVTSSAPVADVSVIRARRDQLQAIVDGAKGFRAQVYAEIGSLPQYTAADAKVEQGGRRLDAVGVVLAHLAETHATNCGVCGADHPAGALEARAGVLRAMTDQWRATQEDRLRGLKRRQEYETWLGNEEPKIASSETFIATLTADIQRLTEISASLGKASSADMGASWLPAAVSSARALVVQLEANAKASESIQRAREQEADLRRTADDWKRAEMALDTTIAGLVQTSLSAFVERVRAFLPTGDSIEITAEPFQIRLLHDGKRYQGLSGAEGVGVLCAIACAAVDVPSVLIPDERAYDGETLAALMAALKDAPAQVILTSTSEPTGEHAGWTVIHTEPEDAGASRVIEAIAVAVANGDKKTRAKRRSKEQIAADNAAEALAKASKRPPIDLGSLNGTAPAALFSLE